MCNPVVAVMVVSAVMAAKSASDQAKAQKDAANFNAQFDERRAQDALERGKQEVFKSRLKQAQVVGAQRAGLAARGLSLGEGSPLAILTETKYLGDFDAATIQTNAERDAWALRTSAGFEANKARQISPSREAATSLLSNAGSIAAAADA
jgi:hypothetical protein